MGTLDGAVVRPDTNGQFGRVCLLWRGDRRTGSRSERADALQGPLFDAFSELHVPTRRVVYSDDEADEVRTVRYSRSRIPAGWVTKH